LLTLPFDDRGRVIRLELIEHRDDAVDVGVLVVEAVERAGEADRVAGIIPLIELLAAEKDDTAASKARRNNLIRVAASAFAAWK
jgi:hypothetical protein